MKIIRMIICIMAGLYLAGCATYLGTPKEPMNLKNLTTTFSTELESIKGSTITIDKATRDDYIGKALTIMDFNYSTFVNDLGTEKPAILIMTLIA